MNKVTFWVDIDGDDFIFRRFSRHYGTVVGVDVDSFVNRRPQDCLPPRLADTVLANYRACRDLGQSVSYEELLELGAETRWWNTTLSPILNDDGVVASLIGVSDDITAWKEAGFEAGWDRTRAASMTKRLQHFARHAVDDVRGPCAGLLSLVHLIGRDLTAADTGRQETIRQMERLIEELMDRIDGLRSEVRLLTDRKTDEMTIDLGHLCADLCALVDPHKQYDILFPTMVIDTDRSILQTVLRTFIENAKRYSRRLIEIEVADCDDGFVHFSVIDDGVGPSPDFRCDGTPLLPADQAPVQSPGLAAACSLVASHGGSVEAGLSEDGSCVVLVFSLRGYVRAASLQDVGHGEEADTLGGGVSHRFRLVV